MMTQSARFPLACLLIALTVLAWSAIHPYDRSTWWMEVAPFLIAAPLLAATFKNFRLTNLLYALILFQSIILMIGGHYTYARVPFFKFAGEARNNFDKLGHFAQGFVPAIVIRELLLRTSSLKPGKWISAIMIFSCLGISALYELIEWGAAMALGQGADEFLGTQGDVWDTQKDMMWAGIGAVCAVLFLSRAHDRALHDLREHAPG